MNRYSTEEYIQLTNKHTKICLTSLVIKLKPQLEPLHMHHNGQNLKKNTTPKAGKDVKKMDDSYIVRGNIKWHSHSRKNSLTVS